MCENLSIADKLARVRDKLNRDKVQLWTPPYYVPEIGPSDSDLQVKFVKQRKFSCLPIYNCVVHLP